MLIVGPYTFILLASSLRISWISVSFRKLRFGPKKNECIGAATVADDDGIDDAAVDDGGDLNDTSGRGVSA